MLSADRKSLNLSLMKPYQKIAIEECGEFLVPIPLNKFAVESPHPYAKLGANYAGKSPYYLRQGVLNALIEAQEKLQQIHHGWQIKIFDAYRPIAVQQFMVDYTFASVLQDRGLNLADLSPAEKDSIWQEVYELWAVPSEDSRTPPPHSTGAAIDITLVDEFGQTQDLGSEIDELSDRSAPDYYANSTSEKKQRYHYLRLLLQQVMNMAGFRRHPREWWHFSRGDQMWAWLYNLEQENPANFIKARYGRIE